jgi:crotonobetainyl-CoA:carnitine CoA-transferase CaiB-like acyl-CoA transferase
MEATGPLKGIKIVELAMWAAGPMVAGILSDWGADVIKIEAPDGDPYRALNVHPGVQPTDITNPNFNVNNRNKRGIVLNLKTEEGRSLARKLIIGADVFLTNMRPGALERLGLDYEAMHRLSARLIYCHVTGYGAEGEWRDRAGAFGDYYTALAAAGGICAALVGRQATGKGQRVLASLLRTGAYAISSALDQALLGYPVRSNASRTPSFNPLINCYKDRDGKWFWLLCLQGDRFWPGVTRAIGRPDLLGDPRFDSLANRGRNSVPLMEILDEIFKTRTIEEWGPTFDREDVWYTPANDIPSVLKDAQMRVAGCFTTMPTTRGDTEVVPAPIDFSETPWNIREAAPELGQHTEEILLEMGHSWDEIAKFKERGTIS